MNRDEHACFDAWKSAHERLMALERILSDAWTVYARDGGPQPFHLAEDVAEQRRESDRLLSKLNEGVAASGKSQ